MALTIPGLPASRRASCVEKNRLPRVWRVTPTTWYWRGAAVEETVRTDPGRRPRPASTTTSPAARGARPSASV